MSVKIKFDKNKINRTINKSVDNHLRTNKLPVTCPHCKNKINVMQGSSICPKCGKPINLTVNRNF